MSQVPDDRSYHREHVWIRRDGSGGRVGVTDFAQDSLGDLVAVTLPAAGAKVVVGEACGELESTKSDNAIVAPVTATVVAGNQRLEEHPELINTDPYGEGWLFEVEGMQVESLAGLLDAAAYHRLVGA